MMETPKENYLDKGITANLSSEDWLSKGSWLPVKADGELEGNLHIMVKLLQS